MTQKWEVLEGLGTRDWGLGTRDWGLGTEKRFLLRKA